MHIKHIVRFQAFAKWRWANGGAGGLMIAHFCWEIVSYFQAHKMVNIWSKKSSRKTAAKQGIYTISGTKLGGETKDLPKGIYIVNGKKVVK